MLEASISTVVAPVSSHDLTTLAAVKAELAIPTTDTSNDSFLSPAITQSSAVIAGYCGRIFQVEALQDLFYVRRGAFPWRPAPQPDPLQLARWPVTVVTSAVQTLSDGTTTTLVQGTDFTLDAARGWLYRLDSQGRISWSWEPQVLTVQYSAGYTKQIAGETATVPSNPGPYTATVANASSFAVDLGVTYASSGAALTKVSSAPAAGQYSVNTVTGVYTFAAADAGAAVKIGYSYAAIPDDVASAALRLVTSRYRSKGRDPALRSEMLPQEGSRQWWVGPMPGQGGSPFPPDIEAILDPYRVPGVA